MDVGFKVRVCAARDRGSHELVGGSRDVAAANRFLRSLQIRGLSPCTVRAYAYDLLVLFRWLARTSKSLRRLQQSQLLEWVAAQRADDASPSSINRRLVTCRLLVRFVTGKEMVSGPEVSLPAPHYRGRGRDRDLGLHAIRSTSHRRLRVKIPRRVVEPLTADEVRAFLRSLRRYRDLAIVHLMLLCGLRSHEVLTLGVSDVDFEERRVRICGKGDKERVLPLPAILVTSLTDYLRLERPVACSTQRLFVVLQGPQRGRTMTPPGLRSLFRHRRGKPILRRANAHRFRHTFGADMARAGVRLPILQRMMGHAHGKTTLQYIHLSMADIADEYRRAIAEIEKRYRPS
jgi:site-specific recombinase XerD